MVEPAPAEGSITCIYYQAVYKNMSKQIHPLTDLPQELWEMVSWLEEICPFQEVQKYVKYYYSPEWPIDHSFSLYTKEYQYNIKVRLDDKNKPNYISATVLTRKPRAGEDWNRGNDLPDGKYSREKWDKIKGAIIAAELVKVAHARHFKKEKHMDDTPYLSHVSTLISHQVKNQ